MKIKKGFVVREVGGENVVVPVGEMSRVFHGMIHLNETGAFLWKFFSEEHTIEEGVVALLNDYEVEEAIARKDVENFAKTVQARGFVE